MAEFVYSDRYTALGIETPIENICEGQCEGTGWVPIYCSTEKMPDGRKGLVPRRAETDPRLVQLWIEAEEENPADDGWHFVKCPYCGGTGKNG